MDPTYDYQYNNNRREPSPQPPISPARSPYHDRYSPQPVSAVSVPPAYASRQYLEPDQQKALPLAPAQEPSPFDTVFDDHVYPMNSNTPASSQQHLPGKSSPYYGSGQGGSEENMYGRQQPDDIPLRDRTAKDGGDVADHVYDRPRRQKSRKVRFGELGMFGANSKRQPWVVYFFTLVQIAVFIGELVRNGTATGTPIMIQPTFNPMIGPSTYILINMGARFVPCMHNVQGVQSSTIKIDWPCPNTTTSDPTSPSQQCTLSELCGFGGVTEPLYNGDMGQSPQPNQWFRFIIPIFLHAGIVHIGFNLLLQLTMGREMEKSIGSIRFFLVYICSGIFGFVMGGNFAATGIASTGASGSLFGIIALTLLDLLYSWKDRRNPVKDLLFIGLDIVISFVLGLLPGLDNFSHIGGFLMGLALGICVLHSPNALRRRIDEPPYSSVEGNYQSTGVSPTFFKNPVGFFKGRKPLWWLWWLLRAGALVAVTVVFILLLNNFYVYHVTCSWCKYLSCLPVNNWCETGNLQLTNTTKRAVMQSFDQMARLYAES